MTDAPEIRYPNDRLAGLARERRAWAQEALVQLDAEGVKEDALADRLVAMMPAKFIEVSVYDGVYLSTVEVLDEMEAAGELIELGGGNYVKADKFDSARHVRADAA